jgi:folylpolyglutamate synthase/dihydropteroate synthase
MLIAAVPDGFDQARMHQAHSVADALRLANKMTPEDGLVCVTGSLYLVGAVQDVLNGSNKPLGVAHRRAGH